MTLPEQPPVPPAETKEKEYTFDDIANLIYWSFEVSQGIPMQQRATFCYLLEDNISLLEKVGGWKAHLGGHETIDGAEDWQKDPIVVALIDRVRKKRNSKTHTSPDKPTDEDETARQVTQQIASLFSVYRQMTTSERNPGNYWPFILGIVDRDIILSTNNMFSDKKGMPEARARVGGSRFCWYALSKEREAHLAIFPKEIQDLWRKAGDYAQANYNTTFGPDMRKKLDQVTLIYRQQTGEAIKLGQ